MSLSLFKSRAFYIVRRLRQSGHRAFIVGGSVRDMVMGNDPKDYDIVTDASLAEVAALFEHTIPVGAQFGVTMVVEGDDSFEVAQFRRDGVYEDGRRPVSIVTADEVGDVMRRDFTINALLYDPDEDRIIDYISGLADIRDGVIRTIGDPEKRFEEDRLRLLRAVRFAARFGFTIERGTFDAVKALATTVTSVSPERIGEELSKMFSGPYPDRALELLDKTGLLIVVLPEVAAMKGVQQQQQFHHEGDVFAHTVLMLKLFGGGTVTLGLGILLHDIGKVETFTMSDRIRFPRHEEAGAYLAEKILRRLRLSGAVVTRVRMLVKNHMRFVNVRKMRHSTLRRFIAEDGFEELLELYRLDCLASHCDLTGYDFIKGELEHELRERNTLKLPEPLINGGTLIALGYTPGPLFSRILNRVLDMQIEGTVRTEQEAIESVMREFPPASGD